MYVNFEDKLVVMGTYLPECLWSLRGAPRFINDKLFMKIEADMNLNSAKNFGTYVIYVAQNSTLKIQNRIEM